MKAIFDDETFSYAIDGEAVGLLEAKGASAAIARDSKANLSILVQRLQNEVITLQEFYDGFKRETKYMHMAEYALARGGIDQVTDWGRVEEIIQGQWNGTDDFPGLRAFAEDIAKGRYGTQRLSSAVLSRGLAYSSAGRPTYENERLAAQIEKRETEAKRSVGGVEKHCTDCPTWAGFGWIKAALMYAKYAIGMSTCNVSCYCVILTRRAAVDAAQAVGKNAVLALMQSAARATGGAGAVVGALALFRFAANNPAAIQFALRLLLSVFEGKKINV